MRAFHEIRRPGADNPYGVTTFRTDSISFMAHWHHDIELILAESGEIPVGIGGTVHPMRKGDLAIVGSGDIHYYEGHPGGCDIQVVIIPPQMLGQGRWPVGSRFANSFFTSRTDADPASVSHVSENELEILRGLLRELAQEVPHRDAAHADVLRGRIHLFCGTATRLLPCAASTAAGERRHLEKVIRMQKAMDWMASHFRSDITLEALAREMNTSYHHLSRLFSETVGTSFKNHLTRLRVNEADRLLSESTLSITEVALQCGFGSLRTFNRAYRALRGQTPSENR